MKEWLYGYNWNINHRQFFRVSVILKILDRVEFRVRVIGGFRVRVSVILIGSSLGLRLLLGLGLGSVLS